MTDQPLWTPSEARIERAAITDFMARAAERSGRAFGDYHALHRWSVEDREAFWRLLWEYCEVIGEPGPVTLVDGDDIEHVQWFPEGRLNFAENLLRHRGDATALHFRAEDRIEYALSFDELYRQVAAVAAWMRRLGLRSGDRVAACLPNMPETVVAMLAATSLGAVWTSTSPDFGVESVLDRFGQTEPKLLFVTDGYFYNGKVIEVRDKARAIREGLPSLLETVEVPLAGVAGEASGRPWSELLQTPHEGDIEFEPTPFNHPLYILYSSGTTGKPKCITHKVGGVLLQHLKEHRLHSDIRPGDRVFYFTTCGWMMWNWLVSVLASGASAMLYDGSPFYPDGRVLWDYCDDQDFTLFGTSAKYIDAMRKAGIEPMRTHRLQSLDTLCSTGSVLAPEAFDFVYRSIKRDLNLASISGGTDIVSCFVLGCPILPVYRGESQCRGLGMDVQVFDADGKPVIEQKGELVCVKGFPSQPLCFWGDEDGSKYHQAYFARFPNVWHHGDFVCLTRHGGMIIFGRSDATLNPGGVRIGTAEIYRHVEQLDEVLEALVIGQDWDNDVRVVLFVVLREGQRLDDALQQKIRLTVREKCTPRHVPAKIIQVPEIPRTKSGKIVELAVRDVVHGRPVQNLGALANPEALEHFRDLEELGKN